MELRWSDPEHWDELLEVCARIVARVATALGEVQAESDPPPIPGSQFAADVAASESESETSKKCVLDVGEFVSGKAVLGTGHLLAVSDLLARPTVVFGAWPLIRAALEGFGHATWIVRGGSAHGRIQRMMTERLYGLYENRKLANTMKDSEGRREVNERIDTIRAEAEELSFKFIDSGDYAPRVGKKRPGGLDVSGMVLGDASSGAAIYRQASQYVHGMTGALAQHVDHLESNLESSTPGLLEPRVNELDIVVITRLATMVGTSGLGPILDYFGYGGRSWPQIADEVNLQTAALVAVHTGE